PSECRERDQPPGRPGSTQADAADSNWRAPAPAGESATGPRSGPVGPLYHRKVGGATSGEALRTGPGGGGPSRNTTDEAFRSWHERNGCAHEPTAQPAGSGSAQVPGSDDAAGATDTDSAGRH